MKRYISCIACMLMLTATGSFAQADSLQRQINEQVWKQFIKAFNTDDHEGFKAVHSMDLIRVNQDDNRVLGYKEYFAPVPDSTKAKWGNWKKNIQLRFIQRIAGDGKAFEVGYYKSTSTNSSTGESRSGYGKFHVLLRKENGIWKILMDADANENIDESVFVTGKPME